MNNVNVKLIYCMCSVRECSFVTFVDYHCNLETVEQEVNVGISHSIVSQQTTSMAKNKPLVTVVKGQYTDDDNDADREKTTLRRFNTHSILQSVTLDNNGSLVLEEGYINATYAERFGNISVSTVEIKFNEMCVI